MSDSFNRLTTNFSGLLQQHTNCGRERDFPFLAALEQGSDRLLAVTSAPSNALVGYSSCSELLAPFMQFVRAVAQPSPFIPLPTVEAAKAEDSFQPQRWLGFWMEKLDQSITRLLEGWTGDQISLLTELYKDHRGMGNQGNHSSPLVSRLGWLAVHLPLPSLSTRSKSEQWLSSISQETFLSERTANRSENLWSNRHLQKLDFDQAVTRISSSFLDIPNQAREITLTEVVRLVGIGLSNSLGHPQSPVLLELPSLALTLLAWKASHSKSKQWLSFIYRETFLSERTASRSENLWSNRHLQKLDFDQAVTKISSSFLDTPNQAREMTLTSENLWSSWQTTQNLSDATPAGLLVSSLVTVLGQNQQRSQPIPEILLNLTEYRGLNSSLSLGIANAPTPTPELPEGKTFGATLAQIQQLSAFQPLPSPERQAVADVPSEPAPINFNGGIHVQVSAQTIDPDHAEEIARLLADRIRKEIDLLTEQDRFRRGLPTSPYRY